MFRWQHFVFWVGDVEGVLLGSPILTQNALHIPSCSIADLTRRQQWLTAESGTSPPPSKLTEKCNLPGRWSHHLRTFWAARFLRTRVGRVVGGSWESGTERPGAVIVPYWKSISYQRQPLAGPILRASELCSTHPPIRFINHWAINYINNFCETATLKHIQKQKQLYYNKRNEISLAVRLVSSGFYYDSVGADINT